MASPYYVFRDAGAEVTVASIAGGQPPIDPKSAQPEWQTDENRRFDADTAARQALANTTPIADIDAGDFDAIFFPGGHGPMWDFPGSNVLAQLIEVFDEEAKPIGVVCHGPVALIAAQKADATPLVAGKTVSAFINGEEDAVGLSDVVPFLLEDRLRELGATVKNGTDFTVNVITDGNLVTGQNSHSSAEGAHGILALLNRA